MLLKEDGSFKPVRTQRAFDNSHQLISNALVQYLKTTIPYNRAAGLCAPIQLHLANGVSRWSGFADACYTPPEAPALNAIKFTRNPVNTYALEMTGRVSGMLQSSFDVRKHYIGVNCNR